MGGMFDGRVGRGENIWYLSTVLFLENEGFGLQLRLQLAGDIYIVRIDSGPRMIDVNQRVTRLRFGTASSTR